jgi:AraC-like DNA-binding protein
MARIVTTEQWLALASRDGAFSAWRFGFTPVPETRVWPRRVLNDHLIYFCTHNGFKVALPDEVVRVQRGAFFWLMPGVAHETKLLAPRRTFRSYFMRFKLTAEDGVTPVRLQQDWVHREDAAQLLTFVRDLVQELQSPQAFHEQRIRANLMLLSAGALSPQIERHRAVLTSQQRLKLLSFLESHVTMKVTPQQLANEVDLSMPYFRRIFHRSYGISPKHWIVRQRVLLAAAILLETELEAKEVAHRLGYCDTYLFSRQFKQVMGICPRLYRRGQGAEPVWNHISNDMSGSPVLDAARAANKSHRRRAPDFN